MASKDSVKLVGGSVDKVIPDAAITASSYWRDRADHGNGQMWRSRLDNGDTCWTAGESDYDQWIQWDLGGEKVVTRLETKGRHNARQWVKGYKLSFSQDGATWLQYRNGEELVGNDDGDSPVKNMLDPPLVGRYVKLRPTQWQGQISMRAELYGHGSDQSLHPMLLSLLSDIFDAQDLNGDGYLDDDEGAAGQMVLHSISREEAETAWQKVKSDQGLQAQAQVSKDMFISGFTQTLHQYHIFPGTTAYTTFVIQFEKFHASLRAGKMGAEDEQMTRSQIMVKFRHYDTNGDGQIELSEMKEVLQALNPSFSDEDVEQLFQEADRDGDGCITVEEFLGWVLDSTPDLSGQRAHVISKLQAAETIEEYQSAISDWYSLMKPGMMGSFSNNQHNCEVIFKVMNPLSDMCVSRVEDMLKQLSGDTDDLQKIHADLFLLLDADGDGVLNDDEGTSMMLAQGYSLEEARASWSDLQNRVHGNSNSACFDIEFFASAMQSIVDCSDDQDLAKQKELDTVQKVREYRVCKITEVFKIVTEILFLIQAQLGIRLGQAGGHFEKLATQTAVYIVIYGAYAGMKHVKYALLQSRQLGIKEQIYDLVEKKAAEKWPSRGIVGVHVPSYWNFFAMEGIDASGGLSLDAGDDKNLFAKFELPDSDLMAFQALFDASFRKVYTRDRKGAGVPDRLKVIKGQRIQNLHNWAEYKARQQEIASDIKKLQDSGTTVNTTICHELKTANQLVDFELDENANACWLFHGTNAAAAKCITRGDFLVKLAGSNAGTLYGRGVYLGESCAKSDEYSEEDSDGNRCMLVCRATLGNVLYNDERRPPVDWLVNQCLQGPCHSVLGDREKCRGTFKEIIVYDDDQVYPEFIIFYKREYSSSASNAQPVFSNDTEVENEEFANED